MGFTLPHLAALFFISFATSVVIAKDFGGGSAISASEWRYANPSDYAQLDRMRLRPDKAHCASIAMPLELKARGWNSSAIANLKRASILALARGQGPLGEERVTRCLEEIKIDRQKIFEQHPNWRRFKRAFAKWQKDSDEGLGPIERKELQKYTNKKSERESYLIEAQEALENYSQYEPANSLVWIEPSDLNLELPPKGRYESEKEYNARISDIRRVPEITRRHIIREWDFQVGSNDAFFKIFQAPSQEIDRTYSSNSYIGQNAFGAKRRVYESRDDIFQATLKEAPTPWIRGAIGGPCYMHEMVPLPLSYLKKADARVKSVTIADFDLADPDTYTYFSTSSSASYSSPSSSSRTYYEIEGVPIYRGLIDVNNGNNVLAVLSKDLRTLYRMVPITESYSLVEDSCDARLHSARHQFQ